MTATYAPTELLKDIMPSSLGSFTDPTNAWKISIGLMSNSPDQQIGLYDAPGQQPNPKWLLDYPYVQVIVRGAPQGYKAAFDKMRDIYDFLLGLPPQVSDGDRIDGITVVATPSLIGYDQNQRPRISGNFRLILEPAPSSYTNRLPL